MGKSKNKTQGSDGKTLLLRRELVKSLKKDRDLLRKQWVRQMTEKKFLSGLSNLEIETESAEIYDTCVNCIETDKYGAAMSYAKRMAERSVLKGMTTDQIIGGLFSLRDIYGRSLFKKFQKDLDKLSATLDVYEPVANKILTLVSMSFVEEREKIVKEQQQALMKLSTPVLVLREHFLMLPLIGVIDSRRAKQLTEQLLYSIRENRAKVVVMDITGVPNVDSKIANHLIQTIEAARLLGSNVLVSGLSPTVAQTLVAIGLDLSKIRAISDLQSGIAEADKLLGYEVVCQEPQSRI